MIKEAILTNMHQAIDNKNFEQLDRAKKLLELINDPTFIDYPSRVNKLSNLSGLEVRIREAMIAVAPEVATYTYLKETIWPNDSNISTHHINVLVSRLRTKISPDEIIKSVRNKGYKILFNTPISAEENR